VLVSQIVTLPSLVREKNFFTSIKNLFRQNLLGRKTMTKYFIFSVKDEKTLTFTNRLKREEKIDNIIYN